mgnify:CR=1 FL=1
MSAWFCVAELNQLLNDSFAFVVPGVSLAAENELYGAVIVLEQTKQSFFVLQ